MCLRCSVSITMWLKSEWLWPSVLKTLSASRRVFSLPWLPDESLGWVGQCFQIICYNHPCHIVSPLAVCFIPNLLLSEVFFGGGRGEKRSNRTYAWSQEGVQFCACFWACSHGYQHHFPTTRIAHPFRWLFSYFPLYLWNLFIHS